MNLDAADQARLARRLQRPAAHTVDFMNNFNSAWGFDHVMMNWLRGDAGAPFVMKVAVTRLKGRTVRFEWPAGKLTTTKNVEQEARSVDIVVEGTHNRVPEPTLYLELKSWFTTTLDVKTKTGELAKQLVRDRAMFEEGTIRWVFDGSKVTKDEVFKAMSQVIAADPYLRQRFGQTSDEILAAVRKFVEVIP
jgi:hypothetical protein